MRSVGRGWGWGSENDGCGMWPTVRDAGVWRNKNYGWGCGLRRRNENKGCRGAVWGDGVKIRDVGCGLEWRSVWSGWVTREEDNINLIFTLTLIPHHPYPHSSTHPTRILRLTLTLALKYYYLLLSWLDTWMITAIN